MRSPEALQCAPNLAQKLVQVIGATVRELRFGVGPNLFVRVELGCVGRKCFQMKTTEASAHLSDAIAFVDAGVVPEHDHVPGKMAEEMFEERAHLVMSDVVRMALEVETDSLALRR